MSRSSQIHPARRQPLLAGDLVFWDDTLTRDVERIQQVVHSISEDGDELEKRVALDEAERLLNRVQETKRSYKMEIRLIIDAESRRHYNDLLSQHMKKVQEMTSLVQTIRSEDQRKQLFFGVANSKEIEEMADGDYILAEADRLQDKTQDSLDRTKWMVNQSKTLGKETLEELRRQKEKLELIEAEAVKTEQRLVQADKLIKDFGKRIATDRLIQVFAVVNMLLLLMVVLYALFKGGSLTMEPKAPTVPYRARRLLRVPTSLPGDALLVPS